MCRLNNPCNESSGLGHSWGKPHKNETMTYRKNKHVYLCCFLLLGALLAFATMLGILLHRGDFVLGREISLSAVVCRSVGSFHCFGSCFQWSWSCSWSDRFSLFFVGCRWFLSIFARFNLYNCLLADKELRKYNKVKLFEKDWFIMARMPHMATSKDHKTTHMCGYPWVNRDMVMPNTMTHDIYDMFANTCSVSFKDVLTSWPIALHLFWGDNGNTAMGQHCGR